MKTQLLFLVIALFLSVTQLFGQVAEPAVGAPSNGAAAVPAPSDDAADANGETPGEVNAQSGESRRNENVKIDLVDNNAQREANLRVGTTATIVHEFEPNMKYFGAEYGEDPEEPVHASPARGSDIHGEFSWEHLNSIFSARSFFQVGTVKPARQNTFGTKAAVPLWKRSYLSVSGSEDRTRGSVNGNVLIPLASERTPLTTDPLVRPIVQRILDAYPAALPNRTDIAERAYNTNSIQTSDSSEYDGRFDQGLSDNDKLLFRYSFAAQQIDAFQFVKGENANTRTKSHEARITWNRAGERSGWDFSIGFDRRGSLLSADEEVLYPVMVSRTITSLGPESNIPIDRAQNSFHYTGGLWSIRGSHSLMAGFRVTRFQFNGSEADYALPNYSFRNDFGRTAMQNLLMGTPSSLRIAMGSDYRGFRNWTGSFYAGDRWTATRNLSMTFTLRYEPWTKPKDVTGRSNLAFDSDLNNIGGALSIAYRLPGKLGVARAAYGVMYSEMFPATYGLDRFNAPHHLTVNVPNPSLINPYSALDGAADPGARVSYLGLSPDLATPYSFQYNASWETEVRQGWRVQLGYVGSRSHKLFQSYVLNRARYVEGIPFTGGTTNERRPDSRYFEREIINNASSAWYDAGRISLTGPRWRGLSVYGAYWLSKSIDLGGDYTTTGAGDKRNTAAQTEGESHRDLRALSNFDQPHAFVAEIAYETPRFAAGGWFGRALGGWTISAVQLLKSGTPFTINTGADSVGFGNNDGVASDRPILLDPSILGRTIGDPDTSQALLPASAFRYPIAPLEMAGNLGRNTFRKGKIANTNAALTRTFKTGRSTITVGAESVNVFNTPQFAEPGRQLTSPNFGQITNTLNDGRTFMFSLRAGF